MISVMKTLEKMQTIMDESQKKKELMATILQTLVNDNPKKDCDKPHNEEILKVVGEDDKKGEEDD